MSSNVPDVLANDANQREATSATDVELAATEYSKEFSYEDSLNLIGFGKVQLEILFVSGILLMAVINETMGMGIITIASQCDFGTNSQDKAVMSVACFIGILVASYAWGYLSDTSGRRIVLLRTTIAAIIFSLISMFVSNLWVFVVFRFLTGIGIAGASSTVYAYLGEFNAAKYRPIVINYASMFVGISTVYTPVIAWVILPQTWTLSIFGIYTFRPWRILILFNLLPALIGTIWLCYLPETPKLYLSHGKDAEALKVLLWIYKKNTGRASKDFPVKKLKSEVNKEFLEMLTIKKTAWEMIVITWRQTVPLFKPPHATNFVVCCFVMIGLFFTSSGMGLWYPAIQNRLGATEVQMTICQVIDQRPNTTVLEDSMGESICNDDVGTKALTDSVLLGSSYVVAYLILGMVINPLGRKAVLAGSLGLSGISGLALQWVDNPIIVVVLFCGFLMLPGLCISVLGGSVVDLIPTHLRGKAVCICFMVGRFGSVVGSNIIGFTLESYCDITFYLFSGFILFCSLLTLSLPI